jgi:hypothetical protein
MTREIISKATRNEFRELLTSLVLRARGLSLSAWCEHKQESDGQNRV